MIDFDGSESFSSIINISRLDNSLELFKVYPNPFTDNLSFEAEGLDGLKIYDALGRVMIRHDNQIKELNVSELPKGVYLLKAQFGQQFVLKKITKQ